MIRLYCHSVHKQSHSRSFRSFAHSFTHPYSLGERIRYTLLLHTTYTKSAYGIVCIELYYKHKSIHPIGTIVQQKRIQSVLSAFSHSWCIHLFCVRFSLCHNSSFFPPFHSPYALALILSIALCLFTIYTDFIRFAVAVVVVVVAVVVLSLSDIVVFCQPHTELENRETSWRAHSIECYSVCFVVVLLPSMYLLAAFSNSNKPSTSTKGSGIGRSLRDVFSLDCVYVERLLLLLCCSDLCVFASCTVWYTSRRDVYANIWEILVCCVLCWLIRSYAFFTLIDQNTFWCAAPTHPHTHTRADTHWL